MICYTKIIDCYLKNKGDQQKLQYCKNKSIIKLMEILKRNNDTQSARNALLIVLSLFEEKINGDYLSNVGHDYNTLSYSERQRVVAELKKEFL